MYRTLIDFVAERVPGGRPVWNAASWLKATGNRWRYGERNALHVFTNIYRNNRWDDPESRSGGGSNLRTTEAVRRELPGVLREFSVKSLLDVPCGDFYWMKEVDFPPDLLYIGGDIVRELIEADNRLYGRGHVSFQQLDLLKGPLPPVDLILCRDCLVHFSFADVARAIRVLKGSGSTYLLVTHYAGGRNNSDILTGRWRPLRLTAAPFNFPEPLRLIDERDREDGGRYSDKSLALYRLADLPDVAKA